MKFLSVCSGIEAASVAWGPLGWKAIGFSEIEPFPSAVLKHHYPDVLNFGDMTQLAEMLRLGVIELPDLLCGGTPCQAFSVAGLRRSLEDERGNLSLVFCEIANAIDDERAAAGLEPAVIFWENVPGVLNTKDNAFGCFLAGLAGEADPLEPPGGRWANAGCVHGPQRAVAWRVLDAQYFGVAQRRRRVFVVASAREGFDPAAVLFEFDGVRRDIAPSREAGKVAPTIPSRSTGGGGLGTDFDYDGGVITARMVAFGEYVDDGTASAMKARDYKDATDLVAHSLRGEGFDASEGGTGRGTPLVPVAFHPTQDPISSTDVCHAIGTGSSEACATAAVAFQVGPQSGEFTDVAPTLDCRAKNGPIQNQLGAGVLAAMQVRRLTPVECERLQGFPDNYTNIPWRGKAESPDGPRYKALGNSWAVPVVAWIGRRIDLHLMGLL